MTVEEIFETKENLEQDGWTYLPDSNTWSGGSWSHPQHGYVHKGGGSFDNIAEAVERLGLFVQNLTAIQGG